MSSARGYAAFTLDESKIINGRIYCSKQKPDETVLQTSGKKHFVEGEANGKGDFRLDIYSGKGEYHIYMSFFSVAASGQLQTFGNTTGGCDGKPYNYNNPVNTRLDGPGYYSVNDKIKPGSPDYLEGSKIEKPTAGNLSSQQGNISLTQTNEIQVRWMLRRLPK